jgi:excisionase family DNA binding protein
MTDGIYPGLDRAIRESHQRRYAIAAEAGLNPWALSNIIHGRAKPTGPQRKHLADALDVSESELFGAIERPPVESNGHAVPAEPTVPYGLPGLAGRVSVTVQEFALLTGLSVPVIRKLIAQEELRAVQLGNAKPMIPMTEVDKFR